MILVAGGTGRLGQKVVSGLTGSGHEVRVLTREGDRAQGGVAEVVTGDVRDPASLRRAVRGTSVVVSAVHGFLGGRGAGPREVDDAGNANLVRAALDAGVEQVVLVSVLDAAPDHPMALHRAKYAAEQHLRSSGLPWTILRPSAFAETWIEIIGGRLPDGGPALVFGHGDNPINFASVEDVSTLIERAITDPALRGEAVDVPGLDNLTMTELAELLGARSIRRIPLPALRTLSRVLPPLAPAFARRAHTAVLMDTADMSADASALVARFPGLTWHRAREVADRFRAEHAGSAGGAA